MRKKLKIGEKTTTYVNIEQKQETNKNINYSNSKV